MRELSFTYSLRLQMSEPVHHHYFTLRCIPQTDAFQQIRILEEKAEPCDYLAASFDQWGNVLRCGAMKEKHDTLEILIRGKAVTGLSDSIPDRRPELAELFRKQTALTESGPELERLSRQIPCCSGKPLEAAYLLMEAVNHAMVYEKGSTSIQTSALDSLRAGRGVCQDYTHIMLSLLRSRKIACRYAAGMLLGEGESHAWAEVLSDGAWYGFDPTNAVTVNDQYIKLSHGRDAEDTAINRGIFRGDAGQKLQVSVLVAPWAESCVSKETL